MSSGDVDGMMPYDIAHDATTTEHPMGTPEILGKGWFRYSAYYGCSTYNMKINFLSLVYIYLFEFFMKNILVSV